MSALFSKKKKNHVYESVRGADSNALTTVKVNNQIPFCRVFSLKKKEEIERLLLKNRISYFVKFTEHGFFRRLFDPETKGKNVFVIYIHDSAAPLAKELVSGLKDVKMLV